MATFPTPSQILANLKTYFRSLKPGFNPNDNLSDFVIKGKAVAGVVSGIYADQAAVNQDTFIKSARPAAVTGHGQDLNIPQQPATPALSPQVRVTGVTGSPVLVGQQAVYGPTGIVYQCTIGGTINGSGTGYADVTFQCTQPGQVGNIKSPDTLTLLSPSTGLDTPATLEQDMADGSDVESQDSYKQRLLDRFQHPPAGGNLSDYKAFAFAADQSVRSDFIQRFARGLGTVDVYITAGTTDIDTAVTNGEAVVRIPTSPLIASVQAYYDDAVPLTDCPKVRAPVELPVNVTVNVDLAVGITLSTIPADPVYNPLNLTVHQLIQREIGRVLYKYSVGGRILPSLGTMGWVIASDLEEGLDIWLSAVTTPAGAPIGLIPVLADRQVQKLDGSNTNLQLVANQLPAPGTITVNLGT